MPAFHKKTFYHAQLPKYLELMGGLSNRPLKKDQTTRKWRKSYIK
jgi:hypothetical protein